MSEPWVAWRQTAIISATAIAAFVALRWLPLAGGSLHYSDFGAGQRGFLEFCEPGSPQFAPVDRVRSPIALELNLAAPLTVGAVAQVSARLTTANGKAVSADDLLVVHTQKLHLLIIDASLEDYQHVHPTPADRDGAFDFSFTPRRPGRYRVFADFMPRATGRALYAGAVLDVASANGASTPARVDAREQLSAVVDGIKFHLASSQMPLRLNETANIILTVARENGADLVLEDVMGAPAHLVAFDEKCSGFAHLHPAAPSVEVASGSDAGQRLAFSLNLADPGFFRLWAQVRIDGREVFAPFDLRAEP